ncbi:hypothetical protein GE09DRAFT_1106715 [Coniochaeta sp. 2T2.1]|nr:hypothetical protein GE09DRAFT_1106715 [Coniochaeta sp. 2T2.1]
MVVRGRIGSLNVLLLWGCRWIGLSRELCHTCPSPRCSQSTRPPPGSDDRKNSDRPAPWIVRYRDLLVNRTKEACIQRVVICRFFNMQLPAFADIAFCGYG